MYRLFLISFLMVLVQYVNAGEKEIQRSASITVSNAVADPGSTVTVSVTASGFGNINTFETRISFNHEVLEFISVSDLNPAINNAATNLIGDSIFAISWFRFPAQYIADDEILFNLHFQFCCDLFTCAENETESPVYVIENTAFIGFFNPDFTFTQIQLDHTNGAVSSPILLNIITIDQTGQGTVLLNNQPYEQAVVFEQNTQVTIEALPDSDYVFSEWSGDFTGNDNPVSFLITDHMHIVANFSVDLAGPFHFIIDVTGAGNVHVNGTPYTEPLFFYHTNTIYLEATASEGYIFSGWYDENNNLISGEHEYTYIMPDDDAVVVALFSIQTFTITATAGIGGTISPAGTQSAPHGSSLTFAITPDTGFIIADVEVNGQSVGTPDQYTFNNITDNHTIHAAFEHDGTGPPLNVTLPENTVLHNESVCFDALQGITTGGFVHEEYFIVENGGEALLIAGENIRLLPGTTVEYGGYLHASISTDGVFCPTIFIITATAGEGGSISPAGTLSTPSGSDLTFSITPNEGFKIADVTVDDVSVGTPNQYTFSNVTANHTIHASFEPDEIMPPENRSLTDITVQDNESFCFDAIKNITVGGNLHEDCFIVENGGEVWLIAGESIRLLPGTRVENGGYLHASISTDGVFCHGSVTKHTDEQPVADLYDVVEPVKLKTEPIFKMFPNPASATVTILMSDQYVNDHAMLEIYGIGGQRFINKLLTGTVEHVVDIAGLRPGIYLVRLLTDKHAEHQRLIIK